MKKIKIPIVLASLYLLIYQLLSLVEAQTIIIACMFALSPFIVVWMVVRILKDGKYKGEELGKEWGYEDYDPYAKEISE